MKIEALNCPNCGAGVLSDKTVCEFCRSRLKTAACSSCLGLMFVGSRFCAHCGEKTVSAQNDSEKDLGECPRCRIDLQLLRIGETELGECERCDGLWIGVETFEIVCADHEKQAAVLLSIARNPANKKPEKIRYVPCPACGELMNRSNFARASGIIIDTCRDHGVWCDADELPRIVEFIRRGGLDRAREKEKMRLEEQRRMLIDQQRQTARDHARFGQGNWEREDSSNLSIRDLVRFLFD